MPHPSPRTKPSADSSNGLHCPDRDNIPNSAMNSATFRERAAWTPPARARFTSPRFRLPTAWCIAARDDAQAISIGSAGPSKPKAKATRPTVTLAAVPR